MNIPTGISLVLEDKERHLVTKPEPANEPDQSPEHSPEVEWSPDEVRTIKLSHILNSWRAYTKGGFECIILIAGRVN